MNLTSYISQYGDPRIANWPLMANPLDTLQLCALYIIIVKFLGPYYMKNRKPFELTKTITYYNLFQVLFSTWIFYEFAISGWLTGELNFLCEPIDYSDNPNTKRLLNVAWFYFISKFTEFFDTFFFILRKKDRQISVLHVIHHGIMPISTWCVLKFYPAGNASFAGLLNSFVHIIMYSYYFLSSLGPFMQQFLWWKKYLTTIQMIQFIAVILHSVQLLFSSCDYPKSFSWFMISHSVMFFCLFKNFYDSSYNKVKAAKNPHNPIKDK